MLGGPSVSDPFVEELVDFDEELGARSPGWFRATCNRCAATTTGSENNLEDWAYEHAETHRKWTIEKCRRGRSYWHVYAPDGFSDWEFPSGVQAIAFVRSRIDAGSATP